jgi:hypothetical protein
LKIREAAKEINNGGVSNVVVSKWMTDNCWWEEPEKGMSVVELK